MPDTYSVPKGTTAVCNRCGKEFTLTKDMARQRFAGDRGTRLTTFSTCPHCEMTDVHWIYASDVMPEFTGTPIQILHQQTEWRKNN